MRILIPIAIIFMVFFCASPFAYMFIISVSHEPAFLSPDVAFKFTLGNYRAVLATETLHFIDYLKNSLIISGISAILSVMIAGFAAYAITRLHIRGKMFILLFILAISMFPQISLIGYLFKFMTKLGLINTYPALIFPYISWTLPLSLWILKSYFAQIPKELDKAGLIDGCTHFKILTRIIFPVAAPGLVSTALLAFIFAFNEFMFALMLTTDYHARTIPVGIAFFQGIHGEIPWGNIMSASVIAIMPVVILTIAFQRYIIQGLTSGAIKG